RQKRLTEHEQELAARCDEGWLVLLERADWKLRYRELEPTGKHRHRWVPAQQAAISEALRDFEDERRLNLPARRRSGRGRGPKKGTAMIRVGGNPGRPLPAPERGRGRRAAVLPAFEARPRRGVPFLSRRQRVSTRWDHTSRTVTSPVVPTTRKSLCGPGVRGTVKLP